MADGNVLERTFYSLSQMFGRWSGVSRSSLNSYNYQYLVDRPAWLSLSKASQYRQAAADNPVVFGCIDILASAASNGKKYLTDLDGTEVPWDTDKAVVKAVRRLFVDKPNPLQSIREFDYERYWMFYVFGNN
jgi:phage portal protein BeeE